MEEIPWRKYDEHNVLDKLIESSEAFKKFYEAERNKISREIFWCLDPSLPTGINVRDTAIGRVGQEKEEVLVIRLKKIPATRQEGVGIASALEGFIFDSQGLMSTRVIDKKFELISSTLNSMLRVPFLHKRLAEFGFDLKANYNAGREEDYRQLRQRKDEPKSRLEIVHWVFNYVRVILYWSDVLGNPENVDSEFQAWFDVRYPGIAREGRELLKIVRSIGYDEPEKMNKLFRNIIKRYKLNGMVYP